MVLTLAETRTCSPKAQETAEGEEAGIDTNTYAELTPSAAGTRSASVAVV